MPKTRQQLETALSDLQAELPEVGTVEDEQFDYLDFQQRAQLLVESATKEDRTYMHSRVSCVLASAGIIPSETEGEPCLPGSQLGRITAELDKLEQEIPTLQRQYGEQFWSAFAGEADVIEDNAGPHGDYVATRISEMLARHGLDES
ncbi:hypothetical protein J3A72_000419 [Stenotrophomonas sp. PvP093]|uniref:hypothetical protein n=1 Tax=unclassified Stenotrophomonas TaxID=196198 RepID=UPI001FD95943|nr:hypothetical protein [Stenotrophomonas sp. PvP093]MBP2480127.1 hypothetical protein [Stenotrophomonas sp. PvP093]